MQMEPQMHTDEHRLNALTHAIIGCAYKVLNELGCGFLEEVYENALAHELRKAGLSVQQQHPITIRYDGVVVGDYVADLLVEGTVLVELKAVKALDDVHRAQCINYLKATNLPVCLLMNFGSPTLELKRLMGPGAKHMDE
jgi:GxxExxY protein